MKVEAYSRNLISRVQSQVPVSVPVSGLFLFPVCCWQQRPVCVEIAIKEFSNGRAELCQSNDLKSIY